jgi:hypothetical protein
MYGRGLPTRAVIRGVWEASVKHASGCRPRLRFLRLRSQSASLTLRAFALASSGARPPVTCRRPAAGVAPRRCRPRHRFMVGWSGRSRGGGGDGGSRRLPASPERGQGGDVRSRGALRVLPVVQGRQRCPPRLCRTGLASRCGGRPAIIPRRQRSEAAATARWLAAAPRKVLTRGQQQRVRAGGT